MLFPGDTLSPVGSTFLDLVQIRTGSPSGFGSGLLVGPGLVLTALHCVADPERGWMLCETIAANLFRDLCGLDGAPPSERSYRATVIWQPEIREGVEPPDIVLLELKPKQDSPVPIPKRVGPLIYADLDVCVSAVVVSGFPALLAARQLPGGRSEGAFSGSANLFQISRPTISFTSTVIAARDKWEEWSGLSGGPMFRGQALVAIMRGGQPRFKVDRNLEAEPLAPLLRDPRFEGLARRLAAQDEASRPFTAEQLIQLKRLIAAARIKAGAVRDAYIVSHVTAAAPADDAPDLGSRLIDDVAAHGVPAMRRFLARLVADNPDARAVVEGWVSGQPALADFQLGPVPLPGSGGDTVVLIKVTPTAETLAAKAPRERSYELEGWVFDGSRPARRVDPGISVRETKHRFGSLPEVIQTFVTRSLAYLPTGADPIIELTLPFDLLSEDVERWQVKVSRRLQRSLGVRFPLALRSYDRLYDRELQNSWYAWRLTWKRLPPQIDEGALHWVVDPSGWGEELYDAISGRPLICVALACGDADGIGMLVEAGAPVAIWLRNALGDGAATQDELRTLVCGFAIHGLPGRLHEQRRLQGASGAWDGVALLYDDPNRLPPDAEARFQSIE